MRPRGDSVEVVARYVAVDNVCAWPNLTRLNDGSIVAVIFNQPTHGGWQGDAECWASEDEGRTWTRRGVAAPHAPGTNRMNVAAGVIQDGTLLAMVSGWSDRNPPGHPSNPHEGIILPLWLCRSEDGGRHWTHEELGIAAPDGSRWLIPFGDIVALPDESVAAAVYASPSPHAGDVSTLSTHLFIGTDDGRQWARRSTIRAGDSNETALTMLSDGRLLAVARTVSGHLELLDSNDAGATWQPHGRITEDGQHPGHLLVLQDQRVLLTYGIRQKPCYGVGARFSEDGGRNWGPPFQVVDLSWPERPAGAVPDDAPWYHLRKNQDVGYPSSVQLGNGDILTAYYCNGVPAHQRYHMGVVRWRCA